MMTQLTRRVLDDPPIESLEAWLEAGGGRALAWAWGADPDDIVERIAQSGLRGRGGAGFPTGEKWRTVRQNRSAEHPTTVVVNGAEGEPGSFKDRALMLANPYRVLEGALIAAAAMDANQVIVAIKAEPPAVHAALRSAIASFASAGWLARAGIKIVAGPDHYLYGEETALLEVVAGREPFPRTSPPWRRGTGDDGASGPTIAEADLASGTDGTDAPPALVNNVETLANVTDIVSRGPDWFKEVGTDRSPGTLVATVTGAGRPPGVVEVPMGTTLRDTIRAATGEAGTDLDDLIGVLPGVSNRFIGAEDLDVPLTYEAVERIGSGLGAGSFLLVGEDTDPVALAQGVSRFLAVESCGQCRPCKHDGRALAETLDRMRRSEAGQADEADLVSRLETITDGARCYLATQHQLVVTSIVERFGDAFAGHVDGTIATAARYEVAEIAEIGEQRVVLNTEQLTKQPDWTHDETDSGASPADRIDQRSDA